MDPELLGALVASGCCLSMWAAIAAPTAFLAHRRMERVERELGRPALPKDDRALLFYAGASVVWLSALVIAALGLIHREWARMGRNAAFIAIAHFSFAVVLALGSMAADGLFGRDPNRVTLFIVPFIGVCSLLTFVFVWRWTTAREARIRALPATGASDPGALRWILPLTALVFWPAGVVAALVYRAPENVQVGTWALRGSMTFMALVTGAVCGGLVLVMLFR